MSIGDTGNSPIKPHRPDDVSDTETEPGIISSGGGAVTPRNRSQRITTTAAVAIHSTEVPGDRGVARTRISVSATAPRNRPQGQAMQEGSSLLQKGMGYVGDTLMTVGTFGALGVFAWAMHQHDVNRDSLQMCITPEAATWLTSAEYPEYGNRTSEIGLIASLALGISLITARLGASIKKGMEK